MTTKNLYLKIGLEAKEAIQKAANTRTRGNMTALVLQGIVKIAPETKDAILRDK